SVEAVLAVIREHGGGRQASAVADATREVVAAERDRLAAGVPARPVSELANAVMEQLDRFESSAHIAPTIVINATGVIVHTNLGRAPWPDAAIRAAAAVAGDYLLLELDQETGRRGTRLRVAEDHLIALTGAEDALVTNNNA